MEVRDITGGSNQDHHQEEEMQKAKWLPEWVHTIALISHASKVMLKVLQARCQQVHELADLPAGFRKGRGSRDQIANIRWIIKKAGEFQKHIFCFIDYAKAFDCGSQQIWKFLKRWEQQTAWPASWEICMQYKKQQLEWDMEQQTDSK